MLIKFVKESNPKDICDGEAFDYSDGDETRHHAGAVSAVTDTSTSAVNKTGAGTAPHNAPYCRRRHHQDISRGVEEGQDRGPSTGFNLKRRQKIGHP